MRFRKAVYAVIFTHRLKKSQYIKEEIAAIQFDDNDVIDQIFEKYIPIFHEIEEGKKVDFNIAGKLVKEMKFQINKYDFRYQGRSINS